ncbi:MAG: hypothetical protein MUE30_07340 [Spirosomaceae bacterium]|jgi:hypothetical protein|nr:hypothetical protein [Spirosomataceae bacterium]
MKKNTMLSTLFAAMMLASTGGAMAENHLLYKDVKLVKRDAKKVEIRVNQPKGGVMDVELTDNQGVSVYRGTVKSGENIVKLFDLNALPNGEYTLNCTNEAFWSVQRFNIKNGAVEINQDSYQEASAPTVKLYGQNRFEVVSKNALATTITITNNTGEVMYDGKLTEGTVFNLDRLTTGEYRFEFSVGQAIFRQYVSVK